MRTCVTRSTLHRSGAVNSLAPGPRWIGSALRAASLSALLASSAVLGAPQLVLVNGDVFTADPERPRAHALAIEDKRIRAVGDDADIRALAGPTTRVVNVGGRLVTPGLIEAHVHLGWHLPSPPIAMPGLPMPGPTPAQALAAVAAEAKKKPAWISAWIGPIVARDPRNWRDALDAAAPDTPVLLRASWGHTTIVNSAALNRLGIREDVADPLGGWWGRDAKGRLDGHAYESAENIEERAQPSDPQSLAAALRAAGERYARWGVTSIHLMNSRRSLSVTADALARAKTAQRWVVYHWAGAVEHIDDAWKAIDAGPRELPPRVRIEGPKWVLDGTPIERTAFQRSDYAGRPGWRGRSNYDDERLREILRQALHRPEQLALHVVGDAETDRLVAQMEALAPAQAWQAKRVRVEHGDGIRRDTLARVAKLGVVVIQNPLHFTAPPTPLRRRASRW